EVGVNAPGTQRNSWMVTPPANQAAGGMDQLVPEAAQNVVSNGHAPSEPVAPKALVLNATMEPLCVVSSRRAVVLVLGDKADVIQSNGQMFRSERLEMAAPSVVRLRRFVHVPYRRRAALSRRGVFIRDHHLCGYCGRTAE